MVRIGIVEDSDLDLYKRYSRLNEEHEVYVEFVPFSNVSLFIHIFKRKLEEHGFDFDKTAPMGIESIPIDLDIYFVDGLDGEYKFYADKFGRDKTYLNSGNDLIVDEAKKLGYKVLESSLESAIESHKKGVDK